METAYKIIFFILIYYNIVIFPLEFVLFVIHVSTGKGGQGIIATFLNLTTNKNNNII